MVNFVTVRNTPDGPVVSRYRNLLACPYADVVESGDKWYLRGQDSEGSEFYFGAQAGYADSAAATTAMVAVLP